MNKIIDLRSDTVTLPTEKMREAIANAELGDDVFQEDPTVNQLESQAAEIMGKESALLVPSGTINLEFGVFWILHPLQKVCLLLRGKKIKI